MPQYRIPELDLSTRCELGLEMLCPIPERPWGRATELAETYCISRSLLYRIRDRAQEALTSALAPRKPGPRAEEKVLMIDRLFLQRAITVLSVLKGSVRDIQLGLDLLFAVQRSVGHISETLQEVGERVAAYNASVSVPLPVLGEADEIFQGRQPCLTVVDGRSFLVLNLSSAESRDGTTWGLTFLDLLERGVQFHDLVSDGAKGIRSGAEQAQLAVPLRPDLFHLLQEAHRISRRLERAAYSAMKLAERAKRAEQESQAHKHRPGRPLKVEVTYAQAEAQERQAINVYDWWVWLLGQVRQALEPINEEGQLTSVVEARETVKAAIDLLQELDQEEITAFAQDLFEHLEDLLSPLDWLEQSLTHWRKELDTETETLIVWAWQHRQALALKAGEGFPESLRPVVKAFWEVLSLFHRSSSLAESLHSWLRPYLQIHRGMPQWLLPLLMLFWNHHTFQRGKRAGKSPLELAGVDDAPALSEVLDRLLCPDQPLGPELQAGIELPFKLELPFSLESAQVVA
jgi:hypothetical protein